MEYFFLKLNRKQKTAQRILLSNFISLFNSKKDAIKYLNEERNTKYRTDKLNVWLSGERKLPFQMADIMRANLIKHWYSTDQANDLIKQLGFVQ